MDPMSMNTDYSPPPPPQMYYDCPMTNLYDDPTPANLIHDQNGLPPPPQPPLNNMTSLPPPPQMYFDCPPISQQQQHNNNNSNNNNNNNNNNDQYHYQQQQQQQQHHHHHHNHHHHNNNQQQQQEEPMVFSEILPPPLPDIITDSSAFATAVSPAPQQPLALLQNQNQHQQPHHQQSPGLITPQHPPPPPPPNSVLDSAMNYMTISNSNNNTANGNNNTSSAATPQLDHPCNQQQEQQLQPMSSAAKKQYLVVEFINLLRDADPEVARQTSCVLWGWSKEDEGRYTLASSKEMIKMLASLTDLEASCPDSSEITETIYYVSGVLNSLSLCPEGQRAITEGGMVGLINLLGSKHDCIVIHSLTAIHNILVYHEDAIAKFRTLGGLSKILTLLTHDSLKEIHKFLAVVTDCIYRLVIGDSRSQAILREENGVYLLLKTLERNRTHANIEAMYLLERTLAIFKVLALRTSNEPDERLNANKLAIIENGGIRILSNCLDNPDPNVMRACLGTLRFLSDNQSVIDSDHLQPLLDKLVTLLRNDEIKVVALSLDILRNLSCNENNKNYLCAPNNNSKTTIGLLLEAIRKFASSDYATGIKESAVCTLRHLARSGLYIKEARAEICEYGLDVIQEITATNWNDPESGGLLNALHQLLHFLPDNNPYVKQMIKHLELHGQYRLPS